MPKSISNGVGIRAEAESNRRSGVEDWYGRVAELAAYLLTIRPEEVDGGIAYGLETAGQLAGAKWAQLLHVSSSGVEIHRWDGEQITTEEVASLSERARELPWLTQQAERGEVVTCQDLARLPAQADADRETLLAEGVSALLAIPVCNEGRLLGIIELHSQETQLGDISPHVDPLRLLAGAMVGLLQRKELDAARVASEARYRALNETAQVQLEERLQRETLTANLARSFMAPAAHELDQGIQKNLQTAAAIAGADRCYMVAMEMSAGRHPKVYDWSSEHVDAQAPDFAQIDIDLFPWSIQELLKGEPLMVPRVSDLPDEATTERNYLTAAGAVSFLSVPVHAEGEFLGCLAFQYLKEKSWSDHQIMQLRLVGELFTSALRHMRNYAALTESEERFRALAEYSRDPICEVDGKGIILYANPSFEQLLGSEERILLETPFVDLVNVADVGAVLSAHLTTLSGGDSNVVMFRSLGRDGASLFFEATSQGYSTALGQKRVVYVLRDVTARQQSQRALEHQLSLEKQLAELSREILAAPTETIDHHLHESLAIAARFIGADRSWLVTLPAASTGEPETFYWWDPSLEGVDNRRPQVEAADLSSYAERLGTMFAHHIPRVAEEQGDPVVQMSRMVERGVQSFLCIPVYSADAPSALLAFEAVRQQTCWSDEEITLIRIVGEVFVSALDRKRSEQALRDSQSQLLQSQKMEAVGTLAGGIAHDFNNQLAVMLGNARFVIGRIHDDPDVEDALSDLHRSAEHCSQLTRSLLAFSRRTPIMTQALDVGWVVDQAQELLRPLLPASIRFNVVSRDEMDLVIADRTKLQQVLVNLAVNARDAMPSGGDLTLSTCNRHIEEGEAARLGLQNSGHYVELAVSDTGSGISPAVQKRIFEPFFTTKDLGKGTGLGLATAYGIVQECGGALAVESDVGEGATFRIFLPRASDADVYGRKQPEPASTRGSETILLVEDEPGVRRLIERILTRSGYQVLAASDGREALAIAEAHACPIHGVVTDLVMPNMGGIELAENLASVRPEARVMLLSGYAEFSDPQHPLPQGARFLQKPFSDDHFLNNLRAMLDREPDDPTSDC